jgi:hypothetical protein
MELRFTYFTYPQLVIGQENGCLPNDKRAFACWYFYTLAQQVFEKVGDGFAESQFAVLEGDLWMDRRYEQQARSVALLYQLDSPDEFAKFWPYVREQAKVLGLPEPHDDYTKNLRKFIIN